MRNLLWLKSEVDRLNNFDLIRLFAALQVVLWHSTGHMNVPIPVWLHSLLGYFPGVPIFFFLSGMLVTYSLASSTSVGSFYLKRIRRVFPALWLSFGVLVILLIVFHQLPLDRLQLPAFWFWVITQLSFLQFYNPDFFRNFGTGVTNGSLWTISVEIGFYFVLPYVVRAASRTAGLSQNPRRVLEALLIPSILLSYSLFAYMAALGNLAGSGPKAALWVRLLNQTFVPHFWLFGLGILAYLRYEMLTRILSKFSAIVLPVYLAVSCAGEWFGLDTSPVFVFADRLVLCAAILAVGACSPPIAAAVLRGWDLSYGVYVFHMLVINAFVALHWQGSWIYILWVAALSLLLASFSWKYVEAPFIRKKDAVSAKLQRDRTKPFPSDVPPEDAVEMQSVP